MISILFYFTLIYIKFYLSQKSKTSSDMMSNVPTFLKSDPKLVPIKESELQFFARIKSYLNLVKNYEDFRLQEKARALIPWKQMTINAINKMLELRQNSTSAQDLGTDSKDILLIDLIDWFKHEFFKWFDSPVCQKCDQKIANARNVSPNEEEVRWNALTVELYSCDKCGQSYRFPRYNSPEKLLESRSGRCGEWANCFTLMCRSLNFEARLVVDWTDHVWTEVYSNAQKRWLHCDPCEGLCDSPLVYEIGWKKKLTFCLGFASNEVQDVSWRYSADHKALKERRALLCREEWVANVVNKVTDNLQLGMTQQMRNELKLRRLLEFVQFIRVPNQSDCLNDSECKGRQSGSEAWRLARQEISERQLSTHFVFELTDSCVNPSLITYNCATDEYKFNSKPLKTWQKCLFECQNVFRKVERDWKMAYLSRNESALNDSTGKIRWKLSFKDTKWSEIRVTIKCQTFENGSIVLNFYYNSNDGNCLHLEPNKENIIKRSDVSNAGNDVIIEALLKGGTGSNGWQHSQLFRQSLSDESLLNSLIIEIFL